MLAILAMAAVMTSAADDVAAKNRADFDVLYNQSCKVRAYGSYDDMCNKLRKRIKEFEREQAKAAKERRSDVAARPVVPEAPVARAAAPAVAETPTSHPAAAAVAETPASHPTTTAVAATPTAQPARAGGQP